MNGNVAFVVATRDTVIYVDLNQDGLPDPFDRVRLKAAPFPIDKSVTWTGLILL